MYRILENSRAIICAEIVKIRDCLPNPDRRDICIVDYDVDTAQVYDVRDLHQGSSRW